MPQLSRATIKQRAARLRQKGEAALGARLDAMMGSRHTVLMERGGIGRTPCFTPVSFDKGVPGTLLALSITGRRGDRLTGALS
jgi:threonylcarbamoyladenosine tRNA methylthiotransferase MtaB